MRKKQAYPSASRRLTSALLLSAWVLNAAPSIAGEINVIPATLTFLISGGYWEDPGAVASNGIVKSPTVIDDAKDGLRRGYYRLYALRQPDRTAKVYLSQVATSEKGLEIIDSVELQEISDLHAYVTDIRSEDPSGVNRGFGLSATVYLKRDPRSNDPESWSVVVDDFGDIRVEPESH